MLLANIYLGSNNNIDPSASINNVLVGNNVKIAKHVSAFGGSDNLLEIGNNTYIGMNSILNGFAAKIVIGANVSIAQNVNIMVDSGPNASINMQKIFPITKGDVFIGDHCWIGASTIIMPRVILGKGCVVAANSFVNDSFEDFSIIGGTPAKLIRRLNEEEIERLNL